MPALHDVENIGQEIQRFMTMAEGYQLAAGVGVALPHSPRSDFTMVLTVVDLGSQTNGGLFHRYNAVAPSTQTSIL